MNATLNAYKNGQPVEIEAQFNTWDRSYTIELTTDDGATLIVDFEATEQEADIQRGTEYKCEAVYPLTARYHEGEEVHFSDEDETAFEELVRDYFNAQNGEIPYAFRFPLKND